LADLLLHTDYLNNAGLKDFENYKAKAEHYIREHEDNEVIVKLKSNVPLSADDVKELEKILWSEVGSKQDYDTDVGVPLGEFVRSIVGMDMNTCYCTVESLT
jgi:type I restriction enzyme R subunit